MRQKKAKIIQAFLVIFFIIVSMAFFLPILWMMISSFKGTQEFMQVPPTLLPEHFDLGKIGRVYYPAAYMTNENLEYFRDAYEIGWRAIVDTYAEATQHVDQGLSLTLFFPDTATTRDLNQAQIYAWRKGIKTLYYIRIRQQALEGTEVAGCVSCML